ncbi:MAG: hypothetical protein H6513_10945 [Acidimicrobiaceae bacterium]|nr:hypothetical protein [Ilumatobacter sp.]MCB9381196.1 hypothetical protein [Acidimicrobiaceae bacterium]MCO5330183.1 hypothetical protein [Ilumatobacteraceae bacterium]
MTGLLLRAGAAVARRPSLWVTALRQWKRTTPAGWWRRRPFLPVPSADYLHFRLVTQYGSYDHPIDTADVLNYLTWCKRHDQAG